MTFFEKAREGMAGILKGLLAIPLVLLYLTFAICGLILYSASHQVRHVLEWLGVEGY